MTTPEKKDVLRENLFDLCMDIDNIGEKGTREACLRVFDKNRLIIALILGVNLEVIDVMDSLQLNGLLAAVKLYLEQRGIKN